MSGIRPEHVQRAGRAAASTPCSPSGLAVIFGVLGVVNFAHGAFYMLGAFGGVVLLDELGVGFWAALVVVPVRARLLGVRRWSGCSSAG